MRIGRLIQTPISNVKQFYELRTRVIAISKQKHKYSIEKTANCRRG
jgi:hypothetical protein